ncbi:DedD protein [Alteromonadaceae bacterium Bs31]|nr:DedD protein [Alteromonadaceae bacterium Bs31]
MDDGLKQRIVGAFVLIAVGVVFIPVVFDRERIEPLDKRTQIPPAPVIETIEIPVAALPRVEEAAPSGETMFIPDEKQEVADAPVEPVLAVDGTPNSWVLQVASYRYEAHAEEKRDELIKMGYLAYIRPIKTDKGTMRRLFVGPNLDKRKVAEAKKVIDEKFKVNSIVLKFVP